MPDFSPFTFHPPDSADKQIASGPGGEVVIYEDPERQVHVDVRLEKETLWLNLNQISQLFGRDKSVISRHLRKIFREGELKREATVAKYATVQREGEREVVRQVEYFNLDAIISVGYRVNSKRGTQFRIWATQVLWAHLVKGCAVNARRLEQLQKAVRMVEKITERRELAADEAKALLHVVGDYSFALDLLDDYDRGSIVRPVIHEAEAQPITHEEARRIIETLREHFDAGELFGRETDERLHGALNTIFQTVGGRDAYLGLESKAVHLLYFLVKNHPFVDGNKRIGAALFLWFLEKNDILYREDGERRISEEALVALTLLIAESPPSEMETVITVTISLLSSKVDALVKSRNRD